MDVSACQRSGLANRPAELSHPADCTEAVREAEGRAATAAPDVDLAHIQAHALGIAGRSVSALSEADSAAAEAAVGPSLIVFSGGTAFNSVAGTHQPLPARPAAALHRSFCGSLTPVVRVLKLLWSGRMIGRQLVHTAEKQPAKQAAR